MHETTIRTIDLGKIETIAYQSKGWIANLYSAPAGYIAMEQDIYLGEAEYYGYVDIQVSEEKILEKLENGEAEARY